MNRREVPWGIGIVRKGGGKFSFFFRKNYGIITLTIRRRRGVPAMDKQKDWKERQQEADGVIEGRNAVIEALRTGTAIDKRPTRPWGISPPRPGKRASPSWTATGGSWTA